MPYGRSDEDCRLTIETARTILVHTARRQSWIIYSDLNQEITKDTGTALFDFSRDADRNPPSGWNGTRGS